MRAGARREIFSIGDRGPARIAKKTSPILESETRQFGNPHQSRFRIEWVSLGAHDRACPLVVKAGSSRRWLAAYAPEQHRSRRHVLDRSRAGSLPARPFSGEYL